MAENTLCQYQTRYKMKTQKNSMNKKTVFTENCDDIKMLDESD